MKRHSLKNRYNKWINHSLFIAGLCLFGLTLDLVYVQKLIAENNQEQTPNFILFVLLIVFLTGFALSLLIYIISICLKRKKQIEFGLKWQGFSFEEKSPRQTLILPVPSAKTQRKLSFFSYGSFAYMERLLGTLFFPIAVFLFGLALAIPIMYLPGGLLLAAWAYYYLFYQPFLLSHVLTKKVIELVSGFTCKLYDEGFTISGIARDETRKEDAVLILSFADAIMAKEDVDFYYFVARNNSGKEFAFAIDKKDFTPSNQQYIQQVIRNINDDLYHQGRLK